MKVFFRKILLGVITLSILLNTNAYAEEPASNDPDIVIQDVIPELPGVNLNSSNDAESRTKDALQVLAERKKQEQKVAPGWVKNLQKKTIANYFDKITATSTPEEWDLARMSLLTDSGDLFKYYESNNTDTKLYNGFIGKRLGKFINSIDLKKLNAVYRNSQMATPLANWTVESLVVREQIIYIGHFPNAIKNTLNLLGGRHFKGATVIAGFLVFGAVAIYTGQFLYHLSPVAASIAGASFVGNMFFTAFKSSTLAGPLNSVLDCIFGPTNEFVGIQSSRYLGGVRRAVNNFYDKLKPKPKESGEDSRRNDSPNYPDPLKDNMTFANMSRTEQEENWDKCLTMWNGVQSTFGQLLRGNHHAGRSLMMIAWSDEQITRILVGTMDSNLLALANQTELLLAFYKNLIVSDSNLSYDEKIQKVSEFVDHYDLFQSLTDKKWLDLSLSDDDLRILDLEISEHYSFLAQRLMKRDLEKIVQIQNTRRENIRTLFTGLTLNEIRSYMIAEANRNLDAEARLAQRALRKGLQLQSYVDQYENHIQLLMQEMGFKNELKLRSEVLSCKDLFFN